MVWVPESTLGEQEGRKEISRSKKSTNRIKRGKRVDRRVTLLQVFAIDDKRKPGGREDYPEGQHNSTRLTQPPYLGLILESREKVRCANEFKPGT